MRWTERQRAMLREMGIVLQWREAPVVAMAIDAETTGDAATVAAAPDVASAETAGEAAPSRPASIRAAAADLGAGAGEASPLMPADWLVVGEALGPAGSECEQLLDAMLAAIGLSRGAAERAERAAYVALPEPASGTAGTAIARSPTGDGAGDVRRALAAVAPQCVLALGRVAAQALLGRDEPLGSLRGRVHAGGDAAVIVTFSLAYLLRHPADKARAWADLCLAVRTVEAGAPA